MLRLLLIEDDDDFAEIFTAFLGEDGGIEVVKVIKDEHSAIQEIDNGGLIGIDCILSDLQLPASSDLPQIDSLGGIRVLKHARRSSDFYGTIIMMTSSTQEDAGAKALEAGCDGYFCKYTNVGELPDLMCELRTAIHGHVMAVSSGIRHVFFAGMQMEELQQLGRGC
jgi:CheY-like chemotaxis protein